MLSNLWRFHPTNQTDHDSAQHYRIDPADGTCKAGASGETHHPFHTDTCDDAVDTQSIRAFFDTFIESQIGEIVVAVSKAIGLVIIIGAIVNAGWKLWKGQGGGGSNFISSLLMPLVAGALLFNLAFAATLIGFIAQLIFNILKSVGTLLPGLGD